MVNMKKLIIIAVITLTAIICSVLIYTSNQPETTTPKPDKPVVKIGIIYPLSGSGAMYGDIAKVVIKQFFEEFNKKERKYDYQIIFQDNQMNLATSAVLAHRLLNMDKVDVLVTLRKISKKEY